MAASQKQKSPYTVPGWMHCILLVDLLLVDLLLVDLLATSTVHMTLYMTTRVLVHMTVHMTTRVHMTVHMTTRVPGYAWSLFWSLLMTTRNILLDPAR
jgi:hypothetical protein